MMKPSKIKPFLWFEDQAEEAARFYTSIFKDGKMGKVARYPEGSPGKAGSVMTVAFQIDGIEFVALNGGAQDWKFNDAISFVIECDTQAEIDYYWDELTADGGKAVQCGWLKDRFGLSWQVVPAAMERFFEGAKAERAMQAMLTMVKLDIRKLEEAAA
jgi:predicted 3-demethylubiquinone-9 3-methyltransferase (glyoxalase superfamily)